MRRMAKKRIGAVGGDRVIGFRMDRNMAKWLDARATESERTLSQIIRAVVGRAMREGWTFGGPVDPDAARKAGGA